MSQTEYGKTLQFTQHVMTMCVKITQ